MKTSFEMHSNRSVPAHIWRYECFFLNLFQLCFFLLFIPFVSALVLPSGYFHSPLCFCLHSYTDIHVHRCVFFTDHQYFYNSFLCFISCSSSLYIFHPLLNSYHYYLICLSPSYLSCLLNFPSTCFLSPLCSSCHFVPVFPMSHCLFPILTFCTFVIRLFLFYSYECIFVFLSWDVFFL